MNAWNNDRVSSVPVSSSSPGSSVPPIPVATTVHLLRHGKVQNPDGILYGRLPGYRLSSSGRAMADGVADFFCGRQRIDIGYLAASSLERAQQTVAPLAAATGVAVVTDDRLIEAANSFEGTRFDARSLRNPANWSKLRNPARPSWGEPYLQIAHRMLGALYSAEQAARGRVAVLVSHQLPIWTLRRFLDGHRLWHNPAHRECELASLTSVHFADGVISSICYSEPVGHIAAGDDPVKAGA